MTERRRAAELLVQAERMEAIARVAGGVAHEVNNMMTVITGFSGFLEARCRPTIREPTTSPRSAGRRPRGRHHPAAARVQPAAAAAAARRSI